MHRYLGIVGGALMAFILATGLIMGTTFAYFADVQRQQLKTETEMAALAVDALQTGYLEKLPEENYRVTWISPDGQVLYDSDMAASQMENHLEREEVQAAMRKGYGESQRYSGTMTVKMLYSAKRLADGSVLRLSMPQQT
ncbi:MAG: two-component sensor histidine kinase, partial [Selenomonadaceae bacterium]|nr:two-component sensor histidine kinase [Selenomonadaceae bacterium]